MISCAHLLHKEQRTTPSMTDSWHKKTLPIFNQTLHVCFFGQIQVFFLFLSSLWVHFWWLPIFMHIFSSFFCCLLVSFFIFFSWTSSSFYSICQYVWFFRSYIFSLTACFEFNWGSRLISLTWISIFLSNSTLSVMPCGLSSVTSLSSSSSSSSSSSVSFLYPQLAHLESLEKFVWN
jgi:hypothetical protein